MMRDITDKARLEDFLPPMPDFEEKQLPEALHPGDSVDSRRFRKAVALDVQIARLAELGASEAELDAAEQKRRMLRDSMAGHVESRAMSPRFGAENLEKLETALERLWDARMSVAAITGSAEAALALARIREAVFWLEEAGKPMGR